MRSSSLASSGRKDCPVILCTSPDSLMPNATASGVFAAYHNTTCGLRKEGQRKRRAHEFEASQAHQILHTHTHHLSTAGRAGGPHANSGGVQGRDVRLVN